MNKTHLRTVFIAVTFFLTVLCLSATFLLQIRMQRTLDTIAAIPTPTASSTEAAAPSAGTTADDADLPTDSSDVAQIEATLQTTLTPSPVGTQKGETTRRVTAAASRAETTTMPRSTQLSAVLVLNTNTKKVHSPDCSYAKNIKEQNRSEISADELEHYLNAGYMMCQRCKGYAK